MAIKQWKQTDPRDTINKRGTIAILVDSAIFGGTVETKNAWCVWLDKNHLERTFINADSPWPVGWRWISVPPVSWED